MPESHPSNWLRQPWKTASAFATTPLGTFLIIATLSILAFNLLIPVGTGPDESRHIFRVAGLCSGQILPIHFGFFDGIPLWGGKIPLPFARALAVSAQPIAPDWAYNHFYAQVPFGSEVTKQWLEFSNTVVYSPVPYLPAILGYSVAALFGMNVLGTIVLMRICAGLFYITTIGLVIRLLPSPGLKWLTAVIALFPAGLFEASIVTADTVTNTVLIVFSACLAAAVFGTKPAARPLLVTLLISAVMLGTVKPTYAPLAVLVLGVQQIRIWLRLATMAMTVGIAGVWYAVSNVATSGMGLMRQGDDRFHVVSSLQLSGILHDPVNYLRVLFHTTVLYGNEWLAQSVGQMGYFSRGGLAASVVTFIVACGALLLAARRLRPDTDRLWVAIAGLVLAVGIAILIMTTIYLTFTPVGRPYIEGIQGRYFYPLILFATVCTAVLLRRADESRLRALSDDAAVMQPAPALHSTAIFVLSLVSVLSALVTYHAAVLLPTWMPH